MSTPQDNTNIKKQSNAPKTQYRPKTAGPAATKAEPTEETKETSKPQPHRDGNKPRGGQQN